MKYVCAHKQAHRHTHTNTHTHIKSEIYIYISASNDYECRYYIYLANTVEYDDVPSMSEKKSRKQRHHFAHARYITVLF